ncbi:hypothetical protein OUZ56_003267 [Daphnia magna]|uniref:Uncharacterized protein n=1 Tax=Daphnia magna TaxID=35525 RepID=A0ABR0A888_9CRUS|nr:hypothetical protein OUZ56_003267 [Daphnia magna]
MSSEALQLLVYQRTNGLRTKGLELKWLLTLIHLTNDDCPAEELYNDQYDAPTAGLGQFVDKRYSLPLHLMTRKGVMPLGVPARPACRTSAAIMIN